MPDVFSAKDEFADLKKAIKEMGGGWFGSTFFPKDIKFETQDDDEHIVLLTRKHLITNLKWIIVTSMLIFIPMYWSDFPLIASVDGVTRFALVVVWYLGLGLYVMENLLLWFYTVYILTNERVVNVDFFELFYKSVDMTYIRNIEDVNYSQVGIMTSIFDYGNVIIETASEQRAVDRGKEHSSFTFDSVPNPDGVARVVSELMDKVDEGMEGGRG